MCSQEKRSTDGRAAPPEPFAQHRILQQEVELLGERFGAAPAHQQPVLAMRDDAGQATHLRRDDRQARGQRLHCRQPEALVARGHDQHIGGAIVVGQVALGDGARKTYALRNAEIASEGAQPVEFGIAVRIAADDVQHGVRAHPCDAGKKQIKILDGVEPPDEEQHRPAIRRESPPGRRTLG